MTDPTGLDAESDAQEKADAELASRPYIAREMLLNFFTLGTRGVQKSLCAGNDLWTSLNMAYNPIYAIAEGGTGLVQDIQNGESDYRILLDVMQVAGGIAGVTGVGIGVTSARRAGLQVGPSAGSLADDTGSINLSASAGVPDRAASRVLSFGPAPESAWATLNRVDAKGSPLPGYKGGGVFKNDQGLLPDSSSSGVIAHREWDVNPKLPGVNRGGERIVTGSDGSAYYTNNHYESFTLFRGAKD